MSEHSFSRPIRVADVPRAGQTLSVVASAEERADLARAFGLQEIKGLEAQLRLKPRDDGLTVQGRLEAQVVYTCVVTLEPVPGHIIEEIEARFAPEHVRVEPELDEARRGIVPLAVNYTIAVKRDVPGFGLFFLAIPLLAIPAIWRTIRRGAFETQRWAESDYAPDTSSSSDDDD